MAWSACRADGWSLFLGDEEKNPERRLPFDWEGRRSPVFSDCGMLERLENGFESLRGISRAARAKDCFEGQLVTNVSVHFNLDTGS